MSKAKLTTGALFILLTLANVAWAQGPEQEAWKILESGTADTNAAERASAIRVLGLILGNSRAVQYAERALGDREAIVRAAAATALGKMAAKDSVSRLRELLKDKDVTVVMASAQALKSMGDASAFEVYFAILTGERKSGAGLLDEQKKMLHDPKKMAQFGVEQGLGFVPFAGLATGTIKAIRKDDVSPVRAGAAAALSSDPDPRSAEALVAAASDSSVIVRAAALDAIARRNDASLIPKIEAMMKDEKDFIRYAAAAAIVRLSARAQQ